MSYTPRQSPRWALILGFLILGTIALAVLSAVAPVKERLALSSAVPYRAEPAPPPAPTPTPDSAEVRLARADQLLNDGQWPLAVEAYTGLLQTNPLLAVAEARAARALLYQNRMAEGLDHAQRAVDLDPRSAEAQTVLALALDWTLNPDRAVIVARRATELDPASAEALAVLAEAYSDKYRLREADDALDKAESLDRNLPALWRVRGYVLETKTDYVNGIAAYRHAVELAPRHSYLYISLGHALRAIKRYDEAIQAFQTAADLAPTDPRPYGGLGMIHYAREDYAAAQPVLEHALQVDPRYATGYAQLGWIAYVQHDYARAAPLFEQAAALDPDRSHVAQYRHALGWIYLKLEQPDRARQQFESALALNPDLQGARDGLALVEPR